MEKSMLDDLDLRLLDELENYGLQQPLVMASKHGGIGWRYPEDTNDVDRYEIVGW
jgi:hypothetical protein